MAEPTDVGDLAEFTITLTPPDSAPTAVATGVVCIVKRPNGTVDAPVPMVEVSPNVWRYTAAARYTVDGSYTYRVNTGVGSPLVASIEFAIVIRRSKFAAPLP